MQMPKSIKFPVLGRVSQKHDVNQLYRLFNVVDPIFPVGLESAGRSINFVHGIAPILK
jgi:hypothetical protein